MINKRRFFLYITNTQQQGAGTVKLKVSPEIDHNMRHNKQLAGYHRDPGTDQNTVRDSGKRKISWRETGSTKM